MSMIGHLAAVDARAQEEIHHDPDRFAERLSSDDPSERPPHMLRLEKMWQAIHFMLTGVSFGGEGPLSLAVMGGEVVGIGFGYGPAGLLNPELVHAVSSALAGVSVEEFKRRFRPSVMEAEMIYPHGIWERDKDELPEELAYYFKLLVAFYSNAAARNDGMLLWIS